MASMAGGWDAAAAAAADLIFIDVQINMRHVMSGNMRGKKPR
jgi:hypothetical protein